MMYRRGRSDPVIGAVKPANKAAPTAAELVEQRTGAKGKCEPAKHVPGSGPGKRVTGAGAHTECRKA